MTPQNTFGDASGAQDVITVRLEENPNSGAQDLDFCVVSGADTPTEDPSYTNGATFAAPPSGPGPYDQSYKAGPGVTDGSTTSGGSPDTASSTSQATPSSGGAAAAVSNPEGVDRARYTYKAGTGGVRVGVVGLTTGAGSIKAFFDDGGNGSVSGDVGNYSREAEETQAPSVTLTLTAGGKPGSAEAFGAVTGIAISPADGLDNPGVAQFFAAKLTNSSGDKVRGVRPSVAPDASGANPNASPSCDESDNDGVSRCTYTGTNPGSDTLTVYVNKAGGSAQLDDGEVRATTLRTTTKSPVGVAQARFVDLTPRPKTVIAGSATTFVATVTDASGAPAQGVPVTFTESGPGTYGTPTTVNTDRTGRATARLDTLKSDTGDQSVTAAISSTSTQCSQQAGFGTGATTTTPAGRCSDQVTTSITPPPSPSPSASPTPSKTATASPSATSTATTSTSPSPVCNTAQVSVNTPTINATGLASVTAFGATPNTRVELQGYSQDHFGRQSFDNDATPVDRAGTADSNGTITFNDLRPSSNTRVRARQVGCAYGQSAVINVRTTIFLKVTRDGPRTYTFEVDSIPARPGGLIVSIYRITGNTCAAGVEPRNCPGEPFVSQTRVGEIDGAGSRTLQFDPSYGGREQFVLKTGQDAQNAPGRSNVRDLAIF